MCRLVSQTIARSRVAVSVLPATMPAHALPAAADVSRMRAPCRYAPKARYLPRLRDLFLANFPGESL